MTQQSDYTTKKRFGFDYFLAIKIYKDVLRLLLLVISTIKTQQSDYYTYTVTSNK